MENTVLKDLAGNILDPHIPRYEAEDSGWIDIEPLIGTKGIGHYIPQYRRIGKFVYMRGLITNVNQLNVPILTLPENCRQSVARLNFCTTNDECNVNEVRIIENGNLLLLRTTGTIANGVTVNFSGISFPVD